MEIATKHFGLLEVEEQDVYVLAEGLYGLEDYKEYVLIRPDEKLPFSYLQARQEQGACLFLADPFAFQAAYEFDLQERELEALGSPQQEDLTVWVTVSVKDNMQDATMNLLAPIVLNQKRRIGMQVVLHNSGYPTKTRLFPPKKEGE